MTHKTIAAEDDRNPWIGVAIIVLGGGVCAAVFALIYLSAAFMDRNSDRTMWQLWLGASAGLTLASIASGVIVATVRRRSPKFWAVPACLLLLPMIVMLVLSSGV